MPKENNHFNNSYRRCLVDMHIDDRNPTYLSCIQPEVYADMMQLAKVDTAEIYANGHTGLCYWPTKTGKLHANLSGQDLFGNLVSLCRKRSMKVVAYYSVIYNNWAYDNYPEWRMVDSVGGTSCDHGKKPNFTNRYGLCCPNSENHREFIKSQLTEIISNYDIQGFFIDMTFWPTICYCENCIKKYRESVGHEPPRKINWDDPDWIAFYKLRTTWIAEFANMITAHIKLCKSELSVVHNYGASMAHWLPSVNMEIASASDYLGGDRYGGLMDQSFACKLFYNLTENLPFEYMSSRCEPDLVEHTTLKSVDTLALHSFLAMAHRGAFTAIDAIEPNGELNKEVYLQLEKVFSKTKLYESEIGGHLAEDVAIYFSFNSKTEQTKQRASAEIYWGDVISDKVPHIETAVNTAKTLKEYHIPFGVISKHQIGVLSQYKIIVIPAAANFDQEEIIAFLEYVEAGGRLYASGAPAIHAFGNRIGITDSGRVTTKRTYISPVGKTILKHIDPRFPLSIDSSQPILENNSNCEILAKTVLPYTDPDDSFQFASIHSDPPGIWTDNPSIIRSKLGMGYLILANIPIESIAKEPHMGTFIDIIKSLAPMDFSFSSDAPPEVEITLFRQEENSLIVNIINMQDKRSVLPIFDFSVNITLFNHTLHEIVDIPTLKKIPYSINNNKIIITIDRLDLFRMFRLNFSV